MKKARLIRVENSAAGLIGVLVIDGLVECFTLQPDPSDAHFSIPPGRYSCRRFRGRKYPDTFEVVVPGHTALLFHAGNVEDDSEGCILLGKEVGLLNGRRAVLASAKAFGGFMARMGTDREFDLIIQDYYQEG